MGPGAACFVACSKTPPEIEDSSVLDCADLQVWKCCGRMRSRPATAGLAPTGLTSGSSAQHVPSFVKSKGLLRRSSEPVFFVRITIKHKFNFTIIHFVHLTCHHLHTLTYEQKLYKYKSSLNMKLLTCYSDKFPSSGRSIKRNI
jgi:hypothetical protein